MAPDEPVLEDEFRPPNGGLEFGGPDWSYQRRIVTRSIHAMDCLGWDEIEEVPGAYVHLCRSRARNICSGLYFEKQLVPDIFHKPETRTRH